MKVIVIGAGLAGLAAARALRSAGREVLVVEAGDGPGGRVRTDVVDGFRLDRGFQVLLTAYPECQAAFDYAGLRLRRFKPGALVWYNGRFHRVMDPLRKPLESLFAAIDPFLSLRDKSRVAALVARTRTRSVQQLMEEPETSTIERLHEIGFSEQMIERFFRPFFGGVFLEQELTTSSRLLEFYFKMFGEGQTAVPTLGMGELARQMAEGVEIRYGSEVVEVNHGDGIEVRLKSGEVLKAEQVIVATDGIKRHASGDEPQTMGPRYPGELRWNGTACFHYAAEHAPVREPVLMLNGEGAAAGPVNNFVVASAVSREYAPKGMHLMTASVVGRFEQGQMPMLESRVRQHLRRWFGTQVSEWRLLRAYNLPYALPHQTHVTAGRATPMPAKGMFLAGDVCTTGSLNGALASGRAAAAALLAT